MAAPSTAQKSPAESASSPVQTDPATPPIDLKTAWLAAILSWAIPGAGQIYQGRYFKGVLFFVCILGMFGFGVSLGEGRPVYSHYYVAGEGNPNRLMKKRNYGYLSQFLVGAASMPAIFQTKRFDSPDNRWDVAEQIDADFLGALNNGRNDPNPVEIAGRLTLDSERSPLGSRMIGRLVGQLVETGEPIDLEVSEYPPNFEVIPLGLAISADPRRRIALRVENIVTGPDNLGENLSGSIERRLVDWFQVPLQDSQLQDMNARLGKRWELAMVLTWIAGLLNILSIWDAYEGPAYGYRPPTRKPKPSPS